MTKIYNGKPEIVKEVKEDLNIYGSYLLYMPIKMANSSKWELASPYQQKLSKLLHASMTNYGFNNLIDKYVYLSYECSYTRKGVSQKRPGWHSDGFMTEDVNYILHTTQPTIFSNTQFKVKLDHNISMEQFEAQALPEDEYTLPNNTLIRIDESVVHRASVAEKDEVRTFIKISVSKDKYNLKGNTHNPLFDYNWTMHDRHLVRNHPQIKEVDSVPENFKLEG